MTGNRATKITIDTLDIIGYSVAGEESYVAIPQLNVCFDIGRAPDETLSIDNVFITHGHMDHAAGIGYYCSQRGFREMNPGTILGPESLRLAFEHLLDTWGRIDGNRPPANIVGLEPGVEYPVRKDLFVYPFETNHNYGSLGYTVIERRKKLKDEFIGLAGPEIVKLKKQGIEITNTLNMPLVTYLGDTTSGEFEALSCVQNSKILITECTFFEPDHHERARAGRHYHIDHLMKQLPKWNNEWIIFTHLSRRTDIRYARRKLKEVFDPQTAGKIRFLMDRPRRPRSAE